MDKNAVVIDAMYHVLRAAELMGIDVVQLKKEIKAGRVQGFKRPPVRIASGTRRGKRHQLVVSGAEIDRFLFAKNLGRDAIADAKRHRQGATRPTAVPEEY